MKQLNLVAAALAACIMLRGSSAARTAAAPAAAPARPALNVAFVVYPDMELLDFSGPMDVLVKANSIKPRSYNIYTVGASTKALSTEAGALSIQPRYVLGQSPRPDILIVPGAAQATIGALNQDHAFMSHLRSEAGRARLVMSVCTGAFLLGRAGLLDGKKSTTHWFMVDELQQQFPRTKTVAGRRFVVDGGLVTAAGVSSGLDGALYVVERTRGKAVADGVARAMQYRRNTPAFPAAAEHAPHRSTPVATGASIQRRKDEHLAQSADPCCGMDVEPGTLLVYRHQGHLYGFCSAHCREMFAARPEQYLKSAPAP